MSFGKQVWLFTDSRITDHEATFMNKFSADCATFGYKIRKITDFDGELSLPVVMSRSSWLLVGQRLCRHGTAF